MKIKTLLLVVLLLTSSFLMAQRDLTMEEAVLRTTSNGQSLSPATLAQFRWVPARNAYSYVSGDTLKVVEGKTTTDYPIARFTDLLKQNGVTIRGWQGYRWFSPREIELWSENKQYFLDPETAQLRKGWQLPAEADNLQFAPEGRAVSYNVGESIVALDAKGERYEVANNAEEGIRHGRTVHRNEFGINKGIFWSPQGRHLAYYHLDERMVTEYPLVDISSVPASLVSIRYPMAGGVSHRVMVGVYSLDSRKLIWLDTEMQSDQYFTNIAWSPDSKYIYVAEVNRGQDTRSILFGRASVQGIIISTSTTPMGSWKRA